jgi:hypothetical protein
MWPRRMLRNASGAAGTARILSFGCVRTGWGDGESEVWTQVLTPTLPPELGRVTPWLTIRTPLSTALTVPHDDSDGRTCATLGFPKPANGLKTADLSSQRSASVRSRSLVSDDNPRSSANVRRQPCASLSSWPVKVRWPNRVRRTPPASWTITSTTPDGSPVRD